jgi:hypothetical protein
MKKISNLLAVRIIRYILIWKKIQKYEIGRASSGFIGADQNYYQAMDFFGKKLSSLNLSEKISNMIDLYYIKTVCLNLELFCSSEK